jgi:hypothetical protein
MPKYIELVITKCRGGKRSLWNARHPAVPHVVGAGNTADNAIRDWYKQNKAHQEKYNGHSQDV